MPLTANREPVVTCLPGRDPVGARDARRHSRVVLAGWGLGGQSDLGEQVASELLANAIRHGQAPIWMTLSLDGGILRVEVHDGGAGRAVRRHPGCSDEFGRGLELLDALIELHGGERWVISDTAGPGKTVCVALWLQASTAGPQ